MVTFIKKNQTDVYFSVDSKFRKVSDSLSLTLSIYRKSGRKLGVEDNWKVQRIVDESVNCRSPNYQLLTLKDVLRNHNLRKTNELIRSLTSNKSSNTFKHYPLIFDLM